MGPGVEVSGGSAANTVAGVAALGGKAAFVGKVCDDQLGGVFAHDIRALGVHFDTPPARGGPRHRALPRARHARRAAHHGDVSRRRRHARPRRRGHRPDRRFGDLLRRGLSVGFAVGARRLPQGDGRRARCGAPGGARPVGPVLRRPPLRRLPGARRRRGRYPVRQRGRTDRAVRSGGLRLGPAGDPRAMRGRGADPQREGVGGHRRRRAPRHRRRAGGARGGHHRRGRPLRRRVPARPRLGPAAGGGRAPGRPRRRPRDRPFRRPPRYPAAPGG